MKARSASMVRVAENAAQVRMCFPVMHQLRSHLTMEQFLDMVQRMQTKETYRLAYIEERGRVAAVAGYRYMEMLYTGGKILYVDDLVTDANLRSRGHGHTLLDWLAEEARREGCVELHLDSGVQRFDAHRFYFSERMHVSSYHFRMKL